jgi:hypothetical protein
MHYMRTITAAAILSALIASPVFAEEIRNVNNAGAAYGPYAHPVPHRSYGREARLQRFYRSYNQVGPTVVAPPPTSEAYRNLEGFGFTGRDPSRVGGYNPNLNPPGS